MSVLRVCLFGRFDVRCGAQGLGGLESHKVQELLSFLLLHRDRPHPREALAELLWGDISTSHSKRYLRKVLWQLQSALDSHIDPPNLPTLLVEPDWIQLNPDAHVWLDVALFEEICEYVRGVLGRDLAPEQAESLQSAIDLYKGDLLEGWYHDWCLYERQRLQHMYLVILDKLMGYCEAHRYCEAGVAYGTLVLRYDRARERTHRRLMRLHYLAGDRTAALRQYDQCVAVLGEELNVKPARRTTLLHARIRADEPLAVEAAVADAQPTSPPLLSLVLGRLRQIHSLLDDAQHQIEQDIKAVEVSLSLDSTLGGI
jgi:DNA-binding SARP family transcriptional activator